MGLDAVQRFVPTLGHNDHPYRNGAWRPNYAEYDTAELEVIGEIPADLNGLYVRNTENPMHESIGIYHPFDGDGMLHSMRFEGGEARYQNRFVRTEGFLAELAAGEPLWAGITGDPALSKRSGWGARGAMKDASSTDVVVHNQELISTFYQCGAAYRLASSDLATLGQATWAPAAGVSAHTKVDLASGELLFFNYAKRAPFMQYGVVDATGQLKELLDIDLPGARLPHDMAFTENYAILADLPLFWDPAGLERNRHAVRFYAELPTRFALIPRQGSDRTIRWFEASPTFVLHWLNAYEEGDEVVLDGYFQENPMPDALPGVKPQYAQLMAYVDLHSMRPHIHRWRFNLATGEVREEQLDDEVLEFGTFNPHFAGRKSRYSYSVTGEPGWFLFNGLVKSDLETGAKTRLELPAGVYASEAPFAARPAANAEDDGYLVTFVTDMNQDCSECWVIDAQRLDAGPLCRVRLPHRICVGTHAVWADAKELAP